MSLSFVIALLMGSVVISQAQDAPLTVRVRTLAFTPGLRFAEAFAHDPAAAEGVPAVPAPIKSYLNEEASMIVLKTRKVAFTTKPERASLSRDGELIGEVTLPENVSSAILVFLPGKPGGKARCQIMTIDDSTKAFPVGSFHVTNLSPAPVRFTLETTNYEVQPGKILLIQDPPVGEEKVSGMRAFAHQNNAWNPLSTGIWAHPGKARGVKILYEEPISKRIQLRAFDDVTPSPLPPPPQSTP